MGARDKFKRELLEMLKEEEGMSVGREEEIIYQIDDIEVYGEFEMGYRGVDHNVLISDDVTWEELLTWGTVVVPETKTYISDNNVKRFEDIGYSRMPLNNNHIAGYK